MFRPSSCRPLPLALLIALLHTASNGLSAERTDLAPTASAEQILKVAGTEGGLVIHLGCGNGRLTADLQHDERFVVQGLDADATNVSAARKHVESLGIYGTVSIDRWSTASLPYAENLVALLVVSEAGDVTTEEMLRVVAPGGVIMQKDATGWTKTVKPYPEDIDDWTHYLHDAGGNAVANDLQIESPRHVRWVADPLWSRSHELNPSINGLVSSGGRMFYILDEGIPGLPDLRFPARWTLYARDAFSGLLLWKRPVPNWGYREWKTRGMWSAPLTLNRRVVTDGDRVYVTLGYDAPVTVLDAATGEEIRTISGTDGADEILLSDEILGCLAREQLSVAEPPKTKPNRRLNPQEWTIGPPGPGSLIGLDASSGRELWRLDPQTVMVLTLAAADGSLCFHDDEGVTCLDLKTGKRKWATPCPPMRGSRHSGGTLVIKDGVVLFSGSKGLTAFSMETGEELWIGPRIGGPGISHPPDLFVANGLVWGGDEPGTHRNDRTELVREGRNLKTGEVEHRIEVDNLISPLHHFRCYRSKATERFLLLTKRGVEFVDLNGDQHMRNDWLRAMCHYGFMPCNGLLYVPPHHCFCYPGVKMNGFLALSSRAKMSDTSSQERIVRGAAYEQAAVNSTESDATEQWPTYRCDALRSGHSKTKVSTPLKVAWTTELGGKVTPPVLANGRLFAAQVDSHRLVCLDAASGKTQWTFTAGARVDSPPTIHEGLVLFGCRDGWVYCLRASDGELVWRYRAAPDDRRIIAKEQIESPWPVPGSVLMLDGVAYVAAGRSSFLDGGIYLYGLDPGSGKVLHQTVVNSPQPDVAAEAGRPFDMDGLKGDILVTDGELLHLLQMSFDKQLDDVTAPRASNLGDRISGRRLIATGGFLDDTWYDRTFWSYSNRWPGFYYANDAPKAGQILSFDETTTYGLHVFTERLRLSPGFRPGEHGYELFADDNENEPVLADSSINREKGPGFSRAAPPKWSKQIRLRAMAMVLAGDKLFLAGPPDEMPEDDPYASFEGRLGAELWAVSAKNGEKIDSLPLDGLPAFDGLIAVGGRLYLTTADGNLVCFSAK